MIEYKIMEWKDVPEKLQDLGTVYSDNIPVSGNGGLGQATMYLVIDRETGKPVRDPNNTSRPYTVTVFEKGRVTNGMG